MTEEFTNTGELNHELPYCYLAMISDQEGISYLKVSSSFNKLIEMISCESYVPESFDIYAVYHGSSEQIVIDKHVYLNRGTNIYTYSGSTWKDAAEIPASI